MPVGEYIIYEAELHRASFLDIFIIVRLASMPCSGTSKHSLGVAHEIKKGSLPTSPSVIKNASLNMTSTQVFSQEPSFFLI